MGPLAIIIAAELIFTTAIAGFSSHPKVLTQTKHQISNVLGVQRIAQVDDSPSPSPESSDASLAPADNSAPANPSPDQSPSNTQPTPTESPSDNPSLFNQEINPSPTRQDQNSTSGNPQGPPEAVPTSSPADNSSQTEVVLNPTAAVLNPNDLINSPDNINNQSVDKAKKEDDQLTQTADPESQTKLLIGFATDKVKDMSNFTKSDDFTSTNFAASRFNDQVDKAINNLNKLPPKKQAQVKKQLTNFCDQADSVLRSVQLSVPEQSEQDLEMARGQCQELQL